MQLHSRARCDVVALQAIGFRNLCSKNLPCQHVGLTRDERGIQGYLHYSYFYQPFNRLEYVQLCIDM